MADYKKVIIIGAGRSGTNILRDVLSSVRGIETWPCDEINYIWRHGNITKETDEFSPEDARPEVKKYIQNAFQKFQKKSNADIVLEKTCANSLRVSFVNEVFPDAKFVHIIRDGRDVVNSARKRWTAELDLSYIWQKAKYVPLTDVPYYGLKYFGNRIFRLFSEDGKLASWGPRFEGMDEVVKEYSLEEVCAMQWKRCVEKADDELSQLDSSRVYNIVYADLIKDPDSELKKLLQFLKVDITTVDIPSLSDMLHSDSVQKWKKQLNDEQLNKIMSIIEPALNRFNLK